MTPPSPAWPRHAPSQREKEWISFLLSFSPQRSTLKRSSHLLMTGGLGSGQRRSTKITRSGRDQRHTDLSSLSAFTWPLSPGVQMSQRAMVHSPLWNIIYRNYIEISQSHNISGLCQSKCLSYAGSLCCFVATFVKVLCVRNKCSEVEYFLFLCNSSKSKSTTI